MREASLSFLQEVADVSRLSRRALAIIPLVILPADGATDGGEEPGRIGGAGATDRVLREGSMGVPPWRPEPRLNSRLQR